jgi:hypothetical protein
MWPRPWERLKVAEVNSTFIAQPPAPPPPVNPLTQLGSIASTIGQLQQNRLFPQQQALLGEQVTGQGLQNTGQGISNTQGQLGIQGQYQKNLDMVLGAVPPLPGETKQAYGTRVSAAVAKGAQARLYPPDFGSSWLGGADQGSISFPDLVDQAAVRSQSPTAMEAQFGTPSEQNVGATIQGINTNRVTNQQTPLAGPAATLIETNTPAQMGQVLNVADPLTGIKTAHTFGEFFNADNTPKGPVPPITDIGNLNNATQAALGSAYGPQIADYETRIVPQAIQQQQTIANLRQDAAGFTSGPLASQETKWGEALQQLGLPVPNWSQFGADQTAAREAFAKQVTTLLSQQQATLHLSQTDSARQTAEAAVPGNYTTPEGMKSVLGTLEGNADMIAAGGKAWGQYKAKSGPQSFGEFSMEYPQRMPPLVFQSQYMTPAQIKEQQAGWSASKVDDFNARVAAAKKLGWLPNGQ